MNKSFKCRVWHVVVLLLAAAGVAAAVTKKTKPAIVRADTQPMTPAALCERTFTDRDFGHRVRVPFPALTASHKPGMYFYRPGEPAKFFNPNVCVIFEEPPQSLPSAPVVIGTVSGIWPDSLRRKSGLLGVVVLTDAVLAPAASP